MKQENAEPRLIREQKVREMLAIPKTSFKRLRKKGSFPKPIRLGDSRTIRWSYLEICDFINKLSIERNAYSEEQAAGEDDSHIESPRKQARQSAREGRKLRVRRSV